MAVAYVLAGSIVFGLLALLWYGYGAVTMAQVWGMTHGHAATFHMKAVKLPGGWREEEAGPHSDLHLTRPSKWHAAVETVDVEEFKGADVDFERTMNTLRSLEKMATADGDVAGVAAVDAANAARYACLEHSATDRTVLHRTCLTLDGRYVVRMLGDENSRADFAAILTALTGAM